MPESVSPGVTRWPPDGARDRAALPDPAAGAGALPAAGIRSVVARDRERGRAEAVGGGERLVAEAVGGGDAGERLARRHEMPAGRRRGAGLGCGAAQRRPRRRRPGGRDRQVRAGDRERGRAEAVGGGERLGRQAVRGGDAGEGLAGHAGRARRRSWASVERRRSAERAGAPLGDDASCLRSTGRRSCSAVVVASRRPRRRTGSAPPAADRARARGYAGAVSEPSGLSDLRLWWVKWRWYQRGALPWNRLALHRELARRRRSQVAAQRRAARAAARGAPGDRRGHAASSAASGSPRRRRGRIRIGERRLPQPGRDGRRDRSSSRSAITACSPTAASSPTPTTASTTRQADHLAGLRQQGPDADRRQRLAAGPTSSSPAE